MARQVVDDVDAGELPDELVGGEVLDDLDGDGACWLIMLKLHKRLLWNSALIAPPCILLQSACPLTAVMTRAMARAAPTLAPAATMPWSTMTPSTRSRATPVSLGAMASGP